jgi:hypothetical protein
MSDLDQRGKQLGTKGGKEAKHNLEIYKRGICNYQCLVTGHTCCCMQVHLQSLWEKSGVSQRKVFYMAVNLRKFRCKNHRRAVKCTKQVYTFAGLRDEKGACKIVEVCVKNSKLAVDHIIWRKLLKCQLSCNLLM